MLSFIAVFSNTISLLQQLHRSDVSKEDEAKLLTKLEITSLHRKLISIPVKGGLSQTHSICKKICQKSRKIHTEYQNKYFLAECSHYLRAWLTLSQHRCFSLNSPCAFPLLFAS